MPHQPNRILTINIDFDGCTDTSASIKKLIGFIGRYCKQNPQYKTVVISIGSLRQSIYTDFYNAFKYFDANKGYVSSSLLLNTFREQLHQALDDSLGDKAPEVKRVLMVNSDLYNCLPIGTTLQHMDPETYIRLLDPKAHHSIPIIDTSGDNISEYSQLEFEQWYQELTQEYDSEVSLRKYLNDTWCLSLEDFEDYVEWREKLLESRITVTNNHNEKITLFEVTGPNTYSSGNSVHFEDETKRSQLYNLYQFVINQTQEPFDLLHLDDRGDILDGLENFTQQYPECVPKGCFYQGIDWNSAPFFIPPSTTLIRPKIVGSGKINPNFAQDARKIAIEASNNQNQDIDLADKLHALSLKLTDNYPIPHTKDSSNTKNHPSKQSQLVYTDNKTPYLILSPQARRIASPAGVDFSRLVTETLVNLHHS